MTRRYAAQIARLVLASGSPRRHMLMESAGFEFDIVSPDVDETPLPDETPAGMVRRLAAAKARKVAAAQPSDACVLAADTTVVLDGESLGKPTDPDDAIAMLTRLSGRAHQVHTGFAVVSGHGETTSVVSTDVHFRHLDSEEIESYVATGEPLDKAGSYGLHERGGALVSHVAGSHTNVIGLPMDEVVVVLAAHGVVPDPA